MKNFAILFLAAVLLSLPVFAQNTVPATLDSGITLLKMKEFKKANEVFTELAAKTPVSAEVYYNLGVSEFRLGDYEKAIRALEESLKLKPDYPPAFLYMGFSLENSERFAAAVAYFDKVIAATPESFDAWLEKGVCQFMMKDQQSAIKSMQQAIRIEPAAAYGHRKLADVYFQQSLFPEAAVTYKIADRLEPNVYYINFRIASAYYNDKRFAESLPFFKKASELEPTNQNAQFMLGSAYLAAGNFPPAIESFNKTLEINPEHADAVYGLGTAYLKQKNPEAARKELERLRTLSYLLYSKLDAEIRKSLEKMTKDPKQKRTKA
jgi:tetratricopeptide (TPR) repeat protein